MGNPSESTYNLATVNMLKPKPSTSSLFVESNRIPIAKAIRVGQAHEEVRSILEDTQMTLWLIQAQLDDLTASTEKVARLVRQWYVKMSLQGAEAVVYGSPKMKRDEGYTMTGVKRMEIGDRCSDPTL
ncbi:MAG: hypothetical protein Q9167_001909 [Letrouitia subvulpina]